MDTALDQGAVSRVIGQYRTCEFATVGSSGTPIAWPAVTLYRRDQGAFVITTSIGLPQKAYNVRRNPKVALLFSDPTGSALSGMPEVLVQGVATCPDTVVTSPAGMEEYWARVFKRQPLGRLYGSNALGRCLMGWYYQRLVITVAVTGVYARPSISASDPLTAAITGRTRNDAFTVAARQLPGYRSAVLATVDQHGAPRLLRVRPEVDVDSGTFLLDVPTDAEPRSGPASMLCHSHDAKLWSLRSFVVVGHLEERDGRWALICHRYVPGMSRNPVRAVALVRRCRRTSRDYLQRRQLSTLSVMWNEYNACR
jgi:hypothetical protein